MPFTHFWIMQLLTPQSDRAPVRIEGSSDAERYRNTLNRWKAASESQITALEAADWDAFGEAMTYKDEVLVAWGREGIEVATLEKAADAATRGEWAALVEAIGELDAKAADIIQRVMAELRGSLRRFEFERRVMRSYQSLPEQVTPSYHDKKY
ncbi:hypothetical protein HOK31_04655 [Candidatus Poribacteria bacterium]|nr:hypothetical protein [Candidatus Poribacteria bacterium]